MTKPIVSDFLKRKHKRYICQTFERPPSFTKFLPPQNIDEKKVLPFFIVFRGNENSCVIFY